MFGIPNEVLGMVYNICVAIGVLLILSGITTLLGIPVPTLLLIAGAGAATMSLVLVGIQLLILHEWCDYCLLSALINFAIFGLEFFAL